MSVVLRATWTAQPGHEKLVRDALAELAPHSRAEPGNLAYVVYQQASEPAVFHIFEVYTDDDAVTAHAESEHFKQWGLETAIPRLSERRRDFFQTLDV